MATAVLGYNLLMKAVIGGVTKRFLAVTSNTFSITPKTKASINKDDEGVTRNVFTGYDWQMTAEQVVQLKETGDTDVLDRADIISMVKNGTPIDVIYGILEVGKTVQRGTGIIAPYSENSDSENEATASFTILPQSELSDYVIPTE